MTRCAVRYLIYKVVITTWRDKNSPELIRWSNL